MFKLIKAQYACRCKECGGYIEPRQNIMWSREAKLTYHPQCVPMTAEAFVASLRKENPKFEITLLEETAKTYTVQKIRRDGTIMVDVHDRAGNKIERLSYTKGGL